MSDQEEAADIQNSQPVKTIREILGLDPDVYVAPEFMQTVLPAVALAVPPPELRPPQKETVKINLEPPSPEGKKFRISWEFFRYPAIFVVALAFFYLLLNFRAIGPQLGKFFNPPKEAAEVALKDAAPEYNTWIEQYYVYANDRGLLEPNADPDADALTNSDEFYLGTNPLKVDTDNDFYDDGTELLAGYNPLYEGELTADQKSFLAQNIDMKAVASRQDFYFRRVAGSITEAPVKFEVDTAKPGNITIAKLGVDAPIIWSREFAQMESDLKYGVAHHPATPYPGEPGTSSIHGHSSGYPWDGDFKHAFTKINMLELGDDLFVTVYGKDGTSRRYRFIVQSKKVYTVDDPAQFADLGGSHLNLSTSWPIGTAQKRYVVTTTLAGL